MILIYWVAAAWLITAVVVTLVFLAAKRSHHLHGWLFGGKPAEVHRLSTPRANGNAEPASRIAA